MSKSTIHIALAIAAGAGLVLLLKRATKARQAESAETQKPPPSGDKAVASQMMLNLTGGIAAFGTRPSWGDNWWNPNYRTPKEKFAQWLVNSGQNNGD